MRKQNWFRKHEKAAAAGLCAAAVGITGLWGYHLQDVQARTYAWSEGTRLGTYSATEDEGAKYITEEEMEQRHIQKMRDTVEYLEKFDISYDEDEDAVYYDDRKVRWLIDEMDGELVKYLYDEDGEIDVYTERNSFYDLIGVRVASDKEFRDRSINYKDLETEHPAEAKIRAFSVETIESPDDNYAYDVYDAYEAEIQSTVAVEDGEQEIERVEYNELYEALGITWSSKELCWKYDGSKVKVIYVQDGSFSSWGNLDEDDSICVYVTKESKDGEVSFRVKEMSYDEMSVVFKRSHPGQDLP